MVAGPAPLKYLTGSDAPEGKSDYRKKGRYTFRSRDRDGNWDYAFTVDADAEGAINATIEWLDSILSKNDFLLSQFDRIE